MARYNFTLTTEDGCALYLESTRSEDARDVVGGAKLAGIGGGGYLSFWKRCKQAARDAGAHGRCVILDTYSGEEERW